MIRRDANLPDGSPGWLLISQVEHARISGELAAAWGGADVAPLPFPDVVVPAIYRHDDGWREWEGSPEIEPTHQRPYSFLEIPPATAHRIWTESIEMAVDLGPLAQATIAGHFVELRRRHSGPDSAEAARFIDEYAPHIGSWRQTWLGDSPSHHSAAADRALAALQFFDAWSLWLCCSAATSPTKLSAGNDFALELEPQSPTDIVVRPWPFIRESVTLTATGRLVRARKYLDSRDLSTTTGDPAILSWTFRPAS